MTMAEKFLAAYQANLQKSKGETFDDVWEESEGTESDWKIDDKKIFGGCYMYFVDGSVIVWNDSTGQFDAE